MAYCGRSNPTCEFNNNIKMKINNYTLWGFFFFLVVDYFLKTMILAEENGLYGH